MIIDQLFENNKKPLKEGGPYDLPGIDYNRPGDTPPKRRSAPNDYPYSQEQDDDYFREIFRKKREAAKKAEQDKQQGVAEGWKEDAEAHDEFLAHARQQLQAAHPQERTALAVRLSNLEKKYFGDEVGQGWSDTGIGRPNTGLSAGIEGILNTIGNINNTSQSSIQNMPFGSVTTTRLSPEEIAARREQQRLEQEQAARRERRRREEIRRRREQDQANGEYEPDDNEDDVYPNAEEMFSQIIAQYKISSPERKEQLHNMFSQKFDMSVEEAEEYMQYMVQNGAIEPEEWRQMQSEVNENLSQPTIAVDAKGRTQQEWMQAVKQKFPDAKIMRAKMINGPVQALLSDGRKLVWTKVDQDVAKGGMYSDEEVSWEKGGRRAPTGAFRNPAAEKQVYESFYKVGRMLVERKMSEKEILDVFAQAEQGMTNKDTGANRTMLGRGKDVTGKAVTSAKDAITKVLSSIQNSTPVAGVDVAYDQATDALANALGPNSKVMDSIKKYRLLAKEYPKTQLFVKTALIALAGLATGGAGLPVIAGLTAAVDSAIKGEKLSSLVGKGAGAALMAMAAQEVNSMLKSPAGDVSAADSLAPGEQMVPADGAASGATGGAATGAEGFGGGTYTTMPGDQGGFIAQANGISFPDLKGLNPQITNWNNLPPGTELQLPPSGPNIGSVWDGSATGAGGNQFNLPAADAAQNAAADAKAAADYAAAGPAEKAEILKTTGTPPAAAPSQSGPIYRSPMQMTTQVAGIPVIPGVPLNPTQMMVADFAMQQGNQLSPAVQAAYDLAKRGAVRESVRFKTLPAEQMIDQKLTVLGWALNESVNRKQNQSVHLTNKGVYTVFENVDRYRKAIVEYTEPGREQIPNLLRPDAPGAPLAAPDAQAAQPGMIGKGLNWLNKKAGQVGSALSTAGRQFTTGVTKEKLKMNWHQAGKPTDSDQLAAWLVTQKVPQDVVTDVFGKMGIPYTAPATTEPATTEPATTEPATAATGAQAATSRIKPGSINLATGKPYTAAQIAAHNAAATTAAAATSASPETTAGDAAGDSAKEEEKYQDRLKFAISKLGNKSDADLLTLRQDWGTDPALIALGKEKGKPFIDAVNSEITKRGLQGGQTAVTAKTTAGGPPGFDASNLMKQPGMEKYAKQAATTPAKTPNFAQQSSYAQINQPTSIKYTGMPGQTKTAATPATTANLPTGGGAGVKAAAQTPAAAKPIAVGTSKVGTDGAGYTWKGAQWVNNKTGRVATKQVAASLNKADNVAPPNNADAFANSGFKAPAMAETRIASALKKPVAEMLQMVETKEDVLRIKQFVDQTFAKYGAVTESTFAVRNKIIEHVTKVGARRRREIASRMV